MADTIIKVTGVCKSFPGVQALKDINIDIMRNTVHCIVGENGAGKSTLIKLLTGAERRDEGNITLDGRDYFPKNTKNAMDNGISTLFQELNVVDGLSILDNLTLGEERRRLGIIQPYPHTDKLKELLATFLPGVSLSDKVGKLSIAQKQLLEIIKAVASEAKVIRMDEPTAAITEDEVARLFEIIAGLKRKNVTIIYISHRLSEIFKIGDYITVMRDGRVIDTLRPDEIKSREQLIKMMTGKLIAESYVDSVADYTKKVMEIRSLNNKFLKDISFDLYEGEILGFYGLVGAGKTEIARAVYGVDKCSGGIVIGGKSMRHNSAKEAIKNGVAMLPEERRTQGLCTGLTIKDNIPLMNIASVSNAIKVTSEYKEKEIAKQYIEKLNIKCRSMKQQVAFLSGGNQQKVVFAKCMNAQAKILLLDEPTRGVDVGAKEEIYSIMRECSGQKISIIVFSSELTEILNVCDRIILMREGRICGEFRNSSEFSSDELSAETIMNAITGGEEEGA